MATVDDEKLKELKWARPAADIPERDQLGLHELLRALQLMGTADDRAAAADLGAWGKTPPSMQAIRTGVLGVTKSVTTWVAGAGGLGAVSAAVVAWVVEVRTDLGAPIVVALIAASALLLAATALSIALVVSSDTRARGEAASARHAGRAEVAAAFLAATASIDTSGCLCVSEIVLPEAERSVTIVSNGTGKVPAKKPASV